MSIRVKRLLAVIFGISLGLLNSIALAQTTHQTGSSSEHVLWASEPASFLGIRLGRPVADSLSECPKETTVSGQLRYIWDPGTAPACWRDEVPVHKTFHNAKGLFNAYLYEVDGRVEGLTGEVFTGENQQMLEALTTRFGAPHREGTQSLETARGVSLVNHVYIWQGESVRIEMDTISPSDIAHGDVTVTTRAYDKYLARQDKQETNRLANSF